MRTTRKPPSTDPPPRGSNPRFDAFAKTELAELFNPFGTTESSIEVLGHTRWIDLGFAAHEGVTAEQMESSLGLLGRMAFKRALFEPFSTRLTPKMLAEVGEKRLVYLAEQRRASRKGLGEASPVSTMWVLAPTASAALLRRVEAKQKEGWPAGVWFVPPPLSLGLVIIHALPCIPATLWLRLMGRAQVQQQAFEDLLALPEDAPFRAELLALAVRWRNIKQEEHRFPMTHVEKELWKNSEQLYEQFCLKLKIEGKSEGLREGKSEGLREGKAEGLRTAVRDLCEVLDIPLTEKHEQMLAALDAGKLEALRLQIKRDRRW